MCCSANHILSCPNKFLFVVNKACCVQCQATQSTQRSFVSFYVSGLMFKVVLFFFFLAFPDPLVSQLMEVYRGLMADTTNTLIGEEHRVKTR